MPAGATALGDGRYPSSVAQTVGERDWLWLHSVSSEQMRIVLVTPHGRDLVERRGWTTRPAQLALALAGRGCEVFVVSRTPPSRSILAWRRLAPWGDIGPPFGRARIGAPDVELIEHPYPTGPLESVLVRRLIRRLQPPADAVIVADPRSASVLQGLRVPRTVFDAYDAWDLSPLYADSAARLRQIRRGYSVAARVAGLVTANSPAMAERLRQLGAREVHVLPNGAPPVVETTHASSQGDVIYLGNIQPRVRVDLLLAAASAASDHGRRLRIVGEMQVRPEAWHAVMEHPAVAYEGPRYGPSLSAILDDAAIGIVPHEVTAYTLSQDAMKVWDYLAHGVPVVSTPVPPASSIADLAVLANEPDTFRAAVSEMLVSGSSDLRDRARAAADMNGWPVRASRLLELLSLPPYPPR